MLNILGGQDAKDELEDLAEKGYMVDEDYTYNGGYYQQDNGTWIAWSIPSNEVFVEDFKDKSDAVFYAMGIPVEVSDGSWK